MASRESAERARLGNSLVMRARSPLLWSAALHAVVIAVAVRLPWSVTELRSPPAATVVWVASVLPPPPQGPAAPSKSPATPPVAPSPPRASGSATPPRPSASRSAAPRAETPLEPPRREPRPHRAPPEEASRRKPPTTSSEESERAPPSALDFERERQRVIEELAAEQARERRFSTFSPDDLIARPEPQDPNPWHDVLDPLFDSPGPSEPSHHVMAVGQARTRIGRALRELCHALTGGFGVGVNGLNFMSACATADSGPDLDSPIRPETLKWLPDCRKAPGGEKPSIAEQGLADTSMKCRLKGSAERAAELQQAAEEPLTIDDP